MVIARSNVPNLKHTIAARLAQSTAAITATLTRHQHGNETRRHLAAFRQDNDTADGLRRRERELNPVYVRVAHVNDVASGQSLVTKRGSRPGHVASGQPLGELKGAAGILDHRVGRPPGGRAT